MENIWKSKSGLINGRCISNKIKIFININPRSQFLTVSCSVYKYYKIWRKSVENTKPVQKRQKSINSLTGLKVIAMLLLFWHHSTIPKLPVDIGARTCEFLFVVSGFLVGYNYYYTNRPATWKESFRYAYSKVVKFWPLHFLSMLLVMVVKIRPIFTFPNLMTAILNISLLQAWSPYADVYFSYNGASWFLSALLFCYFMSLFLIQISKKVKKSIILFVIMFLIRYMIEYTETLYPGQFLNLQIHTNPIVRCLEFFMGMLLVPLFIYIKEYIDGKEYRILFSILEIGVILNIIYLIYRYNGQWYRAEYVILFCLVVILFAFDKGILSKFLSIKPFKWFSRFQFEFYILHQAIIICLVQIYSLYMPDWRVMNFCMFITIMVIAILYKEIFSTKCSKILQKIVEH